MVRAAEGAGKSAGLGGNNEMTGKEAAHALDNYWNNLPSEVKFHTFVLVRLSLPPPPRLAARCLASKYSFAYGKRDTHPTAHTSCCRTCIRP